MAFKMKLKTERQPNGEWTAIDEDTYDGAAPLHMMGWGNTEQEAIEDLERLFEERADYYEGLAEQEAEELYRQGRRV
jgi:hypothetical protein